MIKGNNKKQNTAELAYEIAKEAHKGQRDKGGRDYMEHICKVADMVKTCEEKTVAYLHDTIEDTDMTIEKLKESGFEKNILKAVEALTKKDGEKYEDYIKRLGKNKLAVAVKKADLAHNMDLSRIPSPTKADIMRVKKYRDSLSKLKDKSGS